MVAQTTDAPHTTMDEGEHRSFWTCRQEIGICASSSRYIFTYPAVEIVHSTGHTAVVPAMERIFTTFGMPKFVGSDKGPPYCVNEFDAFAKHMDFDLVPKYRWHHGPTEW